jgi:mannose-1-phosphate guanylyltransferase
VAVDVSKDRNMEGVMNKNPTHWGVILAGGSGSRLNTLTTDADGTVIPKQYCSFLGGPSLLRKTIDRLGVVVDTSRIVIVVSAQHRRWWEPELADVAPENVIVQPCNRGTACGVLLPLISILSRDQSARVVVSPSDHYVHDELTLTSSLRTAQTHVDAIPDRLVMLGMVPDRPETGYGWITPSPGHQGAVRSVASFVEKPDGEVAKELMRSGALWSSFTFVAAGETLMDHFRRSMPWLVDKFDRRLEFASGTNRNHALLSLYDRLPTVDFSSGLLEQVGRGIHVLVVPPCGWTDLGTPERVSECAMRFRCAHHESECTSIALESCQKAPQRTPIGTPRWSPVDLAEVALRSVESEAM